MENLVKEARDVKAEVENLKEQLKILQNQLEEKEKIIKNNDNVISWLNRRLADNQSPLQNATVTAPITVPSSVQLTLPRTNKLITNKYETRTPAPSTMQSNMLSGLPMRNPIVQNPNINQTTRMSARSMGVGITDSTMGISTFNKSGQISSTSTPMERINSLNRLSGHVAGSSSTPAVIENNNSCLH